MSTIQLFYAVALCFTVFGQSARTPSITAPQTPATPLAETHWNLIELEGSPITPASEDSRPYLYLHSEGDKLSGSGGCNRLFGSFDLDGNSLQFHSVTSTRMACPGDAMEHEAALLEALRLVTGFRISGDALELRVDDRVLARFQTEKKN